MPRPNKTSDANPSMNGVGSPSSSGHVSSQTAQEYTSSKILPSYAQPSRRRRSHALINTQQPVGQLTRTASFADCFQTITTSLYEEQHRIQLQETQEKFTQTPNYADASSSIDDASTDKDNEQLKIFVQLVQAATACYNSNRERKLVSRIGNRMLLKKIADYILEEHNKSNIFLIEDDLVFFILLSLTVKKSKPYEVFVYNYSIVRSLNVFELKKYIHNEEFIFIVSQIVARISLVDKNTDELCKKLGLNEDLRLSYKILLKNEIAMLDSFAACVTKINLEENRDRIAAFLLEASTKIPSSYIYSAEPSGSLPLVSDCPESSLMVPEPSVNEHVSKTLTDVSTGLALKAPGSNISPRSPLSPRSEFMATEREQEDSCTTREKQVFAMRPSSSSLFKPEGSSSRVAPQARDNLELYSSAFG